ncbi:30S ribosomal protein S15 [Verrucomicrobiales bacterium BCK34]|nr:30S ribosomal protein S15 [Verrucomicrobiales bacterium BCK34]
MSDSSNTTADLKLHEGDTGSADVQIVRLTERILHLTEHMSENKKDLSSRRGLLRLVARRRKLLDYLARTERDRYEKVLSTLGLRR